jgi:hypothetical protein
MTNHHKINNPMQELPLFRQPEDCPNCKNTTLFRNQHGNIVSCPSGCRKENDFAVKALKRSIESQRTRGAAIDGILFATAQILLTHSREQPIKRTELEQQILRNFPDATIGKNPERTVQGWIETLRKEWVLPVGSSKSEPAGYFFMRDADDLEKWRREASSAPITALATIYRVVKNYLPLFAGQLEFADFDFSSEIWNEVQSRIIEQEQSLKS